MSEVKVIYHYCAMFQLDVVKTIYFDGLWSHATGIKCDEDMNDLRKFIIQGTQCKDHRKITVLSLTRL